MKVKVIALLTLLALCVNESSSSAIPMWEYLSRDEKMSHLYSMFAKQVQAYCKEKLHENSSQCKHNMMMYGIIKLNDMEDSHLDQMDPYQRNANNILWNSMMNGPDYEKDDRQQYLQQEQYKQQNPSFIDEMTTGNEEATQYGSTNRYDHDDEYSNHLHDGAATNNNYAYVNKPHDLDNQEHLEQNTNYLMGSMVAYMMPDGTPVRDQSLNVYPVDDDRDDMTMGNKKMPTMEQLYDTIKTMDEEPKIIMELPPTSTTSTPTTTTSSQIDAAASSRTIRTLYGVYKIN
ncbi:CLUMA_CG019591, isoform A [Clunio marinus]|uniref:CLUMA_CG019591, isoform A n=1 Tax=Clunio marinus TaxID=568069 RepID=A0A1J1J348_9DIPT|nr:CLUMA_CG019591, isoform A [Clunio marinus]